MKNRVLVYLVLGLLMLVPGELAAAAEKQQLTVMTYRSDFEHIQLFQEAYPDVEVQIIFNDPGLGYLDRLLLLFAGGTPPDVILLDTGTTCLPLLQEGLLEDIAPWVEMDPDLRREEFPEVVGPYMFYMPYLVCPLGMFYRSDLVDQAGMSRPELQWFFNDFLAMASKIQQYNADGVVTLYGVDGHQRRWTWNLATGLYFYDDTGRRVIFGEDEKTLEALNFIYDLTQVYKVMPPYGHWGPQFLSGTTGSGIYSPSVMKEIGNTFEYAIAPVPIGPHGDVGQQIIIRGWAMPKSGKNKELAWEFIRFMCGDYIQTLQSDRIDEAPANGRIAAEGYLRDFEFREQLLYILQNGVEYIANPIWLGDKAPLMAYEMARRELDLNSFYQNQKSLRQVIDQSVPVMQAILDDAWRDFE